jgi:hypothetical protein
MICPKCARAVHLEYDQNKCPHCGAEISSDMAIKIEEGLRPPSLDLNVNNNIPKDSPVLPLWDNNGPFFIRLFNTWKESMFHPGRFFKNIPTNNGLVSPLMYAIIIGFISTAGAMFWQILFMSLQIPFMAMSKEFQTMLPFETALMPIILCVFVILSPLTVTIVLFIWTGILHLFLMIFGGNTKGFEATFRSTAYGTSPHLFQLIPVCGAYVGLIWTIIITIIGLKETHKIPLWKAVVAYLLPIILCCVCAVVAILFIGIGIFTSLKPAMSH